jgi:hypothetical protein
MLEWGQLTSQPGSLVRDAKRRPVFTGSRVSMRAKTEHRTVGKVLALLSEIEVLVSWGGTEERVPAAKLVVQR